jgi:methionyl-tRNA formyltransferase
LSIKSNSLVVGKNLDHGLMIAKKDFRIIFMGTPEFAVESLKLLVEDNYHVAGVVTNPDKPSGRGRKLTESAVKTYASVRNLPILQPEKLTDDNFIQALKDLHPALQVVVAFKILPASVFTIPEFGTFNLHASLLPNYRGAAPINHVIINGEQKTGVTTFFLDEKMDTGKIIQQKEVPVAENETAGSLHDKLMIHGAKLVKDTVDGIRKKDYPVIPQENLIHNKQSLKKAPKIFKENCRINWKKSVFEIDRLIRGLSPYPAAFSYLSNAQNLSLRIFRATAESIDHADTCGTIRSDNKTFIKIAAKDGFIYPEQIQQAGKKQMHVKDFLKGFQHIESYQAI